MNEISRKFDDETVYVVFTLDTRSREEAGLRVVEFLNELQTNSASTKYDWRLPQPDMAVLDGNTGEQFDLEDTWTDPDAPSPTTVLVGFDVHEGYFDDPSEEIVNLLAWARLEAPAEWAGPVYERMGRHGFELVDQEDAPGRYRLIEPAPVLHVKVGGRDVIVPAPAAGADKRMISVLGEGQRPVAGLEVTISEGNITAVGHLGTSARPATDRSPQPREAVRRSIEGASEQPSMRGISGAALR